MAWVFFGILALVVAVIGTLMFGIAGSELYWETLFAEENLFRTAVLLLLMAPAVLLYYWLQYRQKKKSPYNTKDHRKNERDN